MTHVVRVHQYGGPEVLRYEKADVGDPGRGQIRLSQNAIGINYIDVYQRNGSAAQPSLPFVPGMEGAGIVEAIGSGVKELKVGDRVAYAMLVGAYASTRLVAADRLVRVPDDIKFETAATMMLQGMTACYLLHETFKVGPGTTLLFHAAAGGVGLLVCQWANHLGAKVIGTAGSDEKCELAKANGATYVINYRREDFVSRVREITAGKGVDVVYDAVGKDTFPGSLDCLRPRGLFVSFGASSGAIENFSIGMLAPRGSLFATRPTLATYTASRGELVDTANKLFEVVRKGVVKINVNHTYSLSDVSRAHQELEGRQTTGSAILVP